MADGRTINVIVDFIRERRYKRFAELGVSYGKALKKMLSNENIPKILEEYWAIDIWKEHEGSTEDESVGNARWESVYQDLLKWHEQHECLTLVRKRTSEAVHNFSDGYFDRVFVDADHRYKNVREDIVNWLPKIRTGGLMIGHDYNMEGVREAVNDVFSDFFHTRIWRTWTFEVSCSYFYMIKDGNLRNKMFEAYPKHFWSR